MFNDERPTASCFGDRASEYDKWARSAVGAAYGRDIQATTTAILDIGSEQRVLEVGCGTGNHLLPLATQGVEAVGVDASDAMLRIAHDKANDLGLDVRLLHASAESLPLDNESFDVVLCLNALEFVEDQAATVAEMFRVLKPEGTLVVAVLNRRSVWGLAQRLGRLFADPDNAYYRGQFLTRNELRDLLAGTASCPGAAAKILGAVRFPPVGVCVKAWRFPPLKWALPPGVLVAHVKKETTST